MTNQFERLLGRILFEIGFDGESGGRTTERGRGSLIENSSGGFRKLGEILQAVSSLLVNVFRVVFERRHLGAGLFGVARRGVKVAGLQFPLCNGNQAGSA